MAAVRTFYLILYVFIGCFHPFFPLFLHERGYSDSEIGWVLGVQGVAVLVTPMLMAHFADRHVPGKILIAWSSLFSATALISMILVPGFWFFFSFSVLFGLASTPLFNLIDAIALASLEAEKIRTGRAPDFSRLRVWGSVGYILPSVILFPLLSLQKIPYAWVMWGAVVTGLIVAFSTRILPSLAPNRNVAAKALPSLQALEVARKEPLLTFIATRFLLSISLCIFYAFFPIYLQLLGLDQKWIGPFISIGVLAEIALLFAVPVVLAHVSLRGILLIGAWAMVLRLGLLGLFPSVLLAGITQVLHAPIVLATLVMVPMYLNTKCRPEFRNSILSLSALLGAGGGRLLGSVLGGYTAELSSANPLLGIRYAFYLGSALGLISVLWIWIRFHDKLER